MARLGALALGPDDSCYDPDHPWYTPDFWNTDAECACIEAEGRPLGQQCASVMGTIQTAIAPVGQVIGSVASSVGEGIGTGVAAGASGFASNVNLSGLVLLGVAGFVAYALLSKR